MLLFFSACSLFYTALPVFIPYIRQLSGKTVPAEHCPEKLPCRTLPGKTALPDTARKNCPAGHCRKTALPDNVTAHSVHSNRTTASGCICYKKILEEKLKMSYLLRFHKRFTKIRFFQPSFNSAVICYIMIQETNRHKKYERDSLSPGSLYFSIQEYIHEYFNN